MTGTDYPRSVQRPTGGGPPSIGRVLRGGFGGFFRARNIAALVAAVVVIYLAYFWLVRREVVHHGQVLVLLKKDGSRSLAGAG